MTLIIEDGSNVPNANSYATVEELRTFAGERGISVPADDVEVEALLIRAMDYIETLDGRFYGVRGYDDQPLSWPRYRNYAYTGIPADIKKAQIVLAIAAQTIDLFPNESGTESSATRQTVGPITVEYDTSSRTNRPRIPQADALLSPYFTVGYGQLRVVKG